MTQVYRGAIMTTAVASKKGQAKYLVRVNLPKDLVKKVEVLAVEMEMFRYEMYEELLKRGLLAYHVENSR